MRGEVLGLGDQVILALSDGRELRLPPDYLFLQDKWASFGPRCTKWILPATRLPSGARPISDEAIREMRAYVGPDAVLRECAVDMPVGATWTEIAKVDQAFFRKYRGDHRHHSYATPQPLFHARYRGHDVWRIALSSDCQINGRGIVWP